MFAPNSRARKGGKERGKLKGVYGIILGEEEGMPITGEWCTQVNNMLYHL